MWWGLPFRRNPTTYGMAEITASAGTGYCEVDWVSFEFQSGNPISYIFGQIAHFFVHSGQSPWILQGIRHPETKGHEPEHKRNDQQCAHNASLDGMNIIGGPPQPVQDGTSMLEIVQNFSGRPFGHLCRCRPHAGPRRRSPRHQVFLLHARKPFPPQIGAGPYPPVVHAYPIPVWHRIARTSI